MRYIKHPQNKISPNTLLSEIQEVSEEAGYRKRNIRNTWNAEELHTAACANDLHGQRMDIYNIFDR